MEMVTRLNRGRTLPLLNADVPFTQIAVHHMFQLPEAKPDVEDVLEIAADACVITKEVLRSSMGLKVVVKGKIIQRLSYVAATCSQPVHAAESCERFCGFLTILPWMPAFTRLTGVEAFIETVSVSPAGPRIIQICYIVLLVPRCGERKPFRPCFDHRPPEPTRPVCNWICCSRTDGGKFAFSKGGGCREHRTTRYEFGPSAPNMHSLEGGTSLITQPRP